LLLSITVAAASCPPAAAAAIASIEAAITRSCNVFITAVINQSTAMALGHWGNCNGGQLQWHWGTGATATAGDDRSIDCNGATAMGQQE
jgi:hypothetical protein